MNTYSLLAAILVSGILGALPPDASGQRTAGAELELRIDDGQWQTYPVVSARYTECASQWCILIYVFRSDGTDRGLHLTLFFERDPDGRTLWGRLVVGTDHDSAVQIGTLEVESRLVLDARNVTLQGTVAFETTPGPLGSIGSHLEFRLNRIKLKPDLLCDVFRSQLVQAVPDLDRRWRAVETRCLQGQI